MDEQPEHKAGNAKQRAAPQVGNALSRRDVLAMLSFGCTAWAAVAALGGCSSGPKHRGRDDVRVRDPFRLALMQSSLASTVGRDIERFATLARNQQQFRAIGYNSVMWAERARDAALLKRFVAAANDAGVKPLVLQVDEEGLLGDSDSASRSRAVVAHHKWADAAKTLGCEALVVRPGAIGAPAAQADQLAQGLASLSNYTQQLGLRLLVRNGGAGGGMSQNPAWIAGVLRRFDLQIVAALADFDAISSDSKLRVRKDEAMQMMMPFAAGLVMRGLREATALADMPPNRGESNAMSNASFIRKTLDDAIKGRSDASYTPLRGYVFVDVQEESATLEDQAIRATREYIEAFARDYKGIG